MGTGLRLTFWKQLGLEGAGHSATELSCEGTPEGLDPSSSSLQMSWRELLANEDDLWVRWSLSSGTS